MPDLEHDCERFINNKMAKASERWTHEMNLSDFWHSLSRSEQIATSFGNLHYQVYNGGFNQWEGNKYAEVHLNFLLSTCSNAFQHSSLSRVYLILQRYAEFSYKYKQTRDEDSEDYLDILAVLDTDYYKIDQKSLFEEVCMLIVHMELIKNKETQQNATLR